MTAPTLDEQTVELVAAEIGKGRNSMWHDRKIARDVISALATHVQSLALVDAGQVRPASDIATAAIGDYCQKAGHPLDILKLNQVLRNDWFKGIELDARKGLPETWPPIEVTREMTAYPQVWRALDNLVKAVMARRAVLPDFPWNSMQAADAALQIAPLPTAPGEKA